MKVVYGAVPACLVVCLHRFSDFRFVLQADGAWLIFCPLPYALIFISEHS